MNNKSDVLRNFGERVIMCRQALNLSQDELAKRVGYKSRTSINKIEVGVNDVPSTMIKKLAIALHTTPIHLMGWTDTPSYDTDPMYNSIWTQILSNSQEITSSDNEIINNWFKKLISTPMSDFGDNVLQVTKEAISPDISEAKQEITDNDIKFALFGEGSEDITDEMYEDVKRYAQFIKERNKRNG